MADLQKLVGDIEERLKALDFIAEESVKGKVNTNRANIIFDPLSKDMQRCLDFKEYILEKTSNYSGISIGIGLINERLEGQQIAEIYGDSWEINLSSKESNSGSKKDMAHALAGIKKDIESYKMRK